MSNVNLKIDDLILKLPSLIQMFDYRSGPDLYFYKKTMRLRKISSLCKLFDEPDRYIELMYATLVAWDMNSQSAKMSYFDDFKANILKNEEFLLQLEPFKLEKLTAENFEDVNKLLINTYTNMHLMRTKGRLVSNSKALHFLLPDLVMPMDRRNTLRFFMGNTYEYDTNRSLVDFLKIFGYSKEIAQKIDLSQYLDDEWHQSIPKVIDNAILSLRNQKYNKHP
jgi:hypothetical protein